MAKLPSNFNSWKYTAKVIRQIHNTDVSRHFSDIKNDDDLSRGRSGLKAGLIIRAKDSALEILNKQIIFRLGIQQNSSSSGGVASFPMGWVLKPGDDIPQLAIIYRVQEKPRSGNYTIYIPHYNGNKSPNIPSFSKGSFGVILELKDNSKITVYAKSHDYGKNYISKYLLPLVNSNFKTNNYKFVTRKNIAVGTMQPLRADFYPAGKAGGISPLWRHYF